MARYALRQALVWTTIGIFALPSLLGTALHDLMGLRHDRCHSDAGMECDPGCKSPESPRHQDEASVAEASHADDCGFCPICHFLANSKVLPTVEAAPAPRLVSVLAPGVSPCFIARLEISPYDSRGPPRG